MKAIRFVAVLSALVFSISVSAQRKIQVAILLDNSGSMSGLINQAKSQLWNIVNEMASAKAEGRAPEIEIALYEYGERPIQIVPLTKDLDKISEALFALQIRGGDEHCGAVINKGLEELAWSKSNKDLKLIYICGNEAFNQGNVDYKKACKDAISKGVVVNTVFCGAYNEGINTFWKDGADIAEGKYFNIDQNQATVYVETPYDKKINELNKKLNSTYIGYGATGIAKKENQTRQDENAASYSGANAAERTAAKASVAYNASDWDMVDAAKDNKVDFKKLKEEELPQELKGKTPEQIKAYVDEKSVERTTIQKEIIALNLQRTKYMEEEQKKAGQDNTLDAAMKKSMRENAEKIGFTF